MGLKSDDDVTVDDGDGGGKWVSCSICLEVVKDNGDRSWAKLQCGHQFHLDCIGSAFNVKGAMQCPNCRKIEKGQWLYANNCRPLPDFSMDDWTHDEDLYELGYSEMSFGVHWCPFGQLARFPSAFEEGDFSSSAYHDILGHHTIFAEHAAVSSSSHPCPYIAYFGPVHPSSSNSNGNVADSSSFSTPWNGPSIPREVPNSYAFPAMDIHYHSWEHHSPAFSTSNSRVGGGDQPPIASTTQRSVRASSDIHRSGSFMHPFLVNHGSGARAGSSVASTLIPPYPGSNARTRDRVQALQAYYQQQQQQQQQQQPPPSHSLPMRAPIVSGSRRSGNHRGVAQVGSGASSSDQTSGFYFFPAASSGHNFQEPETTLSTRFHSWERDHLPSFLLSQADRESSWEAFQPPAAGSEPGMRPISFRQRHGFERSSSHNRS